MRLIDADALLEDVRKNSVSYFAEDFAHEWVDKQPTIEPERKKGKWERHYSRPNVYADLCWHCSCCGYKSADGWANRWNFCPACGADLREDEE